MRLFTKQINPRSLESWFINNETLESTLSWNSLFSFMMNHDPSGLGLNCSEYREAQRSVFGFKNLILNFPEVTHRNTRLNVIYIVLPYLNSTSSKASTFSLVSSQVVITLWWRSLPNSQSSSALAFFF